MASVAISNTSLSSKGAVSRSPSSVGAVSGTAAGGSATLTATVSSQATGQVLSGQLVIFTLDGTYAGAAVTGSNGIATLSGVPTSDAPGTDTGGVFASYSGGLGVDPSSGTGDLTVTQNATTLSAVSGTATYGGTATLTATLTQTSNSAAISGATVDFTLDGASVGSATTNSSGVATLTGVTTTDTAGTDTNLVASFAGNTTYAAATNATGNLVVSQAATTLSAVSGTATYGGTATLTATLTSNVTGAGIPNETISFTLDGTAETTTATTNSSGVATLTGVTTTDNAGTDANGVVASFSGDTNYLAAANATGNLVVSQAATTLSTVSGTATVGGTATLVATLTSSVTNQGVANEPITFSLNGTTLTPTEMTNSSGVATLSDVTITENGGTYDGIVGASFAGDTNYEAAPAATGNLVVSPADTTLSAVSGTATVGGTATLTATLTSNVTGQGVPNEAISFTLDGTPETTTATTNSSGVATLTGVTTADNAGTDTDGVEASFGGDSNYNAATPVTGNLVVSPADTTLSDVSGTATYGGTATLTATLTSNVTGQGVSDNAMVGFSLDGGTVVYATTSSSGVATLTGVATTDNAGTDMNGITASFAGTADGNYNATASVMGNLVVSQAATTLSSVAGSGTAGGTVTLVATLTSQVTNQGIEGESVSFEIQGVAVGAPVTTDANGVALLTVATPSGLASGTYSGAVTAIYDGSSNYAAAANVNGDLDIT